MKLSLPSDICKFASFLETKGLRLLREEERGSPPYQMIEYGDETVRVQIEQDRGPWNIFIVDSERPEPAYDVELIALLLNNRKAHGDIGGQLDFVRGHWEEIVSCFAPGRRLATHARIAVLARERAKHNFTVWPTAILSFASFFETVGLVCERRSSPEGMFGNSVLQYANPNIAVRMSSGARWVAEFADASTCPREWYSASLLADLIDGPNRPTIPYPKSYVYLRDNWDRISDLFSPLRRKATREQLEELKRRANERIRKRRSSDY